MRNATIDKLVWILIYGGLLVLSLGLFVQREAQALGLALIGGGALAAVLGVVLIVVRARRRD